MQYIVSARKYRPMTFDAVVGQTALTTTLKNAVKSGKLAHAFLFCGPRGVGKTTCARIFAKAINCQHPTADGEACNECDSCAAFNQQRSLNIFELDAASNNSVENIKQLMDQTRIPPQSGRYKVFIIDEVHMLSPAAFNAFLKTLEEPPSYVIFILATTEKHKILPTIISRCQIYDFDRMSVPDIVGHLKRVADREGFTYDEEALHVIAEKADGGMRDALSIFDQTVSYSQGNLTYDKVIENLNVLDSDNYFRIIDLSLENKVADVMLLLNDILGRGFDGIHLVNGLAKHVRDVMMAKEPATLPLLDVSDQQREKFRAQAAKCPAKFLYQVLRVANRCDINYRQSSNKRLLVELTLIEIAQITQDDDASAGRRPHRRLKNLFRKSVASSQPTVAPQVAPTASTARRTPQAAPAPAATPQPAMTPSAQGPSTPPLQGSGAAAQGAQSSGSGRISLRRLSTSINGLLNRPQEEAQQQEEQLDKSQTSQFDQDQVEKEWLSMCNRMTAAYPGLSARMKNLLPHITEYPNIELVVDNSILLDQLNAIRSRIRATLAHYLHNGNIEFTIRLAKADEVTKILTKRELFDEMRQKNPAIERLRQLLDLEMA